MLHKGETMEYQSKMPGASYKEIVVFVKPGRGIIYIGIDEQNYLSGMDTVDEIYTKLTNEIRDAFKPDVTISVRYILQDDKELRSMHLLPSICIYSDFIK